MESLAPPSRAEILAEDVQAARFYLQDGSVVLDFDVLDHGDEVHVAFDGKHFVPPDSRSALRLKTSRPPAAPSVPPPNKAYLASLREVREGLPEVSDVQATALPAERSSGAAARSLAGGNSKSSGVPAAASEGAIANRVMARSLSPDGTEGRIATPGSAEGWLFVRDGQTKPGSERGQAYRVVLAAGLAVAVLLAAMGAWVLLRSASAAVYDRLRAPTCAELGNPAGCKPLPVGCYPPAPWMLPLLQEAADQAVGRMPMAPYSASERTDRLPLRHSSFLAGLWQPGPQLTLRHASVHATIKPPTLDIGACWMPEASRAQLVPDSFVFRFYDWHALLGAEYSVGAGADHSPWRRQMAQGDGPTDPSADAGRGGPRRLAEGAVSDPATGRVLGRLLEEGRILQEGHLSVLAAGAVLLEHIPLWDLGRKGVNVTSCESHFWPVETNATGGDTGGEGGGASLADEAAASGAGQLLSSSLGPLFCDWFNVSNRTGDETVAAGLAEYVKRNPGERSEDARGGGRVGGGRLVEEGEGAGGADGSGRKLAAVAASAGGAAGLEAGPAQRLTGGMAGARALQAVTADEDAREAVVADATGGGPTRPAGHRLELSTHGREGPPWRGLRLEMDEALDDIMPVLLAKVRRNSRTVVAP